MLNWQNYLDTIGSILITYKEQRVALPQTVGLRTRDFKPLWMRFKFKKEN